MMLAQRLIIAVAALLLWEDNVFVSTLSLPYDIALSGRHALPSSTVLRLSPRRREVRGMKTRIQSNVQPELWTTRDVHGLSYDSALLALTAYHRAHGDLAIPGKFVVPATDEYPVEWHGINLARYIYSMKWWQKHISQHNYRVTELNQMGFIWERLQPQWNLFMEGMAYYRSIHGHVLIPATFMVPRNEDWPKACWDLPLGSIVQRLRLRHDFLTGDNAIERRKQLDGLGFVWDVSEYNFVRFFRALVHFDRLERKVKSSSFREHIIRVPSKFVIPSGPDSGWPPDLWDFPLGAKCAAVRQKQLYVKNHPDRKHALDQIGFRWSGNATLGWLDVVHAAAIYSQMHGRVLNVPLSFAVPAPPPDADSNPQCLDKWPWPERLWGLKLGQRLKDVRLKGAYLKGADAPVRKAQLDNLGFVWNPKRGRRKRFIEEEDDQVDDACII